MITQAKCKTIQVNRSFPVEIARKLEAIQFPDLAFLLDQIPETKEEQCELSEWQIQGIENGLKDIEEGRIITHKQAAEWIKSWDTNNELPMPKCK